MTEILTESFCERCGTRYTFETVAPRQKRLGGLKTLGRGLKTFVMSDDTSLDEAMASARSDEEREMTGRQLDAFHKTFNFCMNCRQYTCSNCWNPIEARCLSCAPRADQVIGEPPLQLVHTHDVAPALDELLIAPPDLAPSGEVIEAELPAMGAVDILGRLDVAPADDVAPARAAEPEPQIEVEAEPVLEAVVQPEPALAAESVPEAEAEPILAIEPVAPTNGVEPDLESMLAATTAVVEPARLEPEAEDADAGAAAALFEAAAEAHAAEAAAEALEPEAPPEAFEAAPSSPPEPPTTDERARTATAQTGGMMRRFRPGQSLDDEIAAYEATLGTPTEPAIGEPDGEPEPVAAFEAVPEPSRAIEAPAAAFEPEPVAAEPMAAEPETPEAAPVPEPELADMAPLAAEPQAPAPQRDIVEQPAWPSLDVPAAAEPEGTPEWPTGPRWPTALPMQPSPPAVRPAVPPPVANVPPPFATPPPAATGQPAASNDALSFLTARRAGEAMWAASAQDVVTAAGRPGAEAQLGVRSCVSCGLSLSATARFCRRCGTRQDEV
jgi:hypothetical protein